MSDLLAFRKMITPVIIQIVFWLGVLVCVIVGAGIISRSGNSQFGGASAVTGLLVLVGGPIAVRIYCELLMVLFRIHAAVESIAQSKNS